MSTVTIKIHINENLERTHHFNTRLDRTALIQINRDDIEIQTLTEDLPRAFREYKDIKSKIRDKNYSIHYYSYTEGDVEIDNNDDLITEIDVIFPDDSSDDEYTNQSHNHPTRYVDIRALFQPIKPNNKQEYKHNIIEDIPGQSDHVRHIYNQSQTRNDPPGQPYNNNNQYKANKSRHNYHINIRGGGYNSYKQYRNRGRNYQIKHNNNNYRKRDIDNRYIEAFELDILPYKWQKKMDIKDEGINVNNNNNIKDLEYDNDEKDNNMCYWKNETVERSFYYEQRYNRKGKILLDKKSFSDSFDTTVRRRTRFEGIIMRLNKQRGLGYVTPNYPQKNDKLYGIFFHFEQAFPLQFANKEPIECDKGWKVSFELKMYNKIENSNKFRHNGYRAIHLKIISKGNINKNKKNKSELYNKQNENIENNNKYEEKKMEIKYNNNNNNNNRFIGNVVHILADKQNGYVKHETYGLIVFKFNECHGFDAYDLRSDIMIEYELAYKNNMGYAVNICLYLLPYQWKTFNESNNKWIYESIKVSESLERKYNENGGVIEHIIAVSNGINRKKQRIHRFKCKIIRMDIGERIGYVEMNYNKNIGLIFSFNDCRFDWNNLKIGNYIEYELKRIEINDIIYWKVININQAQKYKKIIIWKWRENENDKYKEYDNKDMSIILEKLKINQSKQLGTGRCVTKISNQECYDVDTLNDTFKCVKRFKGGGNME